MAHQGVVNVASMVPFWHHFKGKKALDISLWPLLYLLTDTAILVLMKGKKMSEGNQQNTNQDAATHAKLQQIQSSFGAAAADYVTSKEDGTLSFLLPAVLIVATVVSDSSKVS